MKIIISKPKSFTAQGCKENQEDALFPLEGEATEQTRVFLVCDGMGGHEHGEVASTCVADTIGRLTSQMPLCSMAEMREAFEKALQQAYHNLDELDHSASSKKMGTTLTFLAICNDGVLTAHIGDSRIYQFRPDKGIIFQTRDHSLVNDLIAAGELKEEEARTFPQRNVITRAIQPHQDYPAKAAYNNLRDIRPGDLFFLCCDGVLEQLENNDLCSLLMNKDSLESRCDAVRKTCAERNTRDNNTAYLIEVTAVEGSSETIDVIETEVPNSAQAGSITLTQPVDPQPAIKHKWWFLLIAVLLVAILVGIYFLFSPNTKKQGKSYTQQTQGTIQRYK